ncbi:hypothetical protein EEL31_09235 [Brevibacillus laterosporus]|nr:DUF1629 domain-containing protein [Brevibacillus laterosporus]TPG68690.1 hypothetical protein EEL31_09235 [Brevibacillus laterosporus]
MKIWLLQHNHDKYGQVGAVDGFDSDIYNPLQDSRISRISTWEVSTLQELKIKGTKWVDVNSYLIMPVCSKHVLTVLNPLIEDSIEWLPIKVLRFNKAVDDDLFFILHVTNIINALDHEKASLKYFSSEPRRLMKINEYSFHLDQLKNQHIFKLTEFPKNEIFVSDQFKDLVLQHQIQGWEFIEVWDSEK